jgi:Ca2+:H+ antiporter
MDLSIGSGSNRVSLYQRLVPGIGTGSHRPSPLNRKPSTNLGANTPPRSQTPMPPTHDASSQRQQSSTAQARPPSPVTRRVSHATAPPASQQPVFSPFMESVDHAVKSGLQPMHLPESMTTDEFTRAVAVATVSALRHHQNRPDSPVRLRTVSMNVGGEGEGGGHGGHDAPSWSRTTSASVLLICTVLYAAIAGTVSALFLSTPLILSLQRSSSMLSMSYWKVPALARNSLASLFSL